MTTRNRIFLAVISLLIGMGLGLVFLLSGNTKPKYTSPYGPGATPPPITEASPQPLEASPTPDPNAPKPAANAVTVYRVSDGPDGPALRPETMTLPSEKPSDEARIAAAIAFMTEGEHPALPKGTKLRRLKIEGTTALLDLSKELKDNFSGGDRAERLAVNALTATAGQLPKIEKVQIFIDGAAVETLGGGQSLLEPLSVPQKN